MQTDRLYVRRSVVVTTVRKPTHGKVALGICVAFHGEVEMFSANELLEIRPGARQAARRIMRSMFSAIREKRLGLHMGRFAGIELC